MSESPRGMPLLSGPPPELFVDERAELSCRKCNKEFNILFARGRRCNHCGYSYCQSCSDYQALMPRRGDGAGYDCMPVCAFCIQYLQITAGGKGFLRLQPLSKLKNYMQAYGLRLGADVIEKDDIINSIMAARTENGCLSRVNENYYRKHTVPSGQTSRPRGLFSRPERVEPQQRLDPRTGWSRTNNFARPDLQADQLQPEATRQWNTQQEQLRQQEQQRNARNQYSPPSGQPPYTSPRHNAPSTPNLANTQPQFQSQRPSSVPSGSPRTSNIPHNYYPSSTLNQRANSSTAARPTAAAPTVSSQPRPRVPALDELLAMHEEEVTVLSIGVLKDVLDNNHVRPGLVLEKGELVARVNELIAAERRERAHAEAVREREAWEAQEREWAVRGRERAAREARERDAKEKTEEERKRRREMYRTTVESASESEGDERMERHSPSSEFVQGRSYSPSPAPDVPPDARKDEAESVERSRSPSPSPRLPPERSGLCVVCQDEDANIVIVDCGHLALCRTCSDLVWSSTRECPLCRTRIVTQARLLRVFKT